MQGKEMICIVCPMGCHIRVEKASSEYEYVVTGNKCPKGEEYGKSEMINPRRVITTTVKIKNARLNRLPVRTNGAIPKDKIIECMEVINEISVEAPIKAGSVVFENILNTGTDIIASRSM